MTSLAQLLPIDWILACVALLLAVGGVGVVRPHNLFLVARVLFPLGAALSLLIALAALAAALIVFLGDQLGGAGLTEAEMAVGVYHGSGSVTGLGGAPPTAPNARTGEFTPPGITRFALSKRS